MRERDVGGRAVMKTWFVLLNKWSLHRARPGRWLPRGRGQFMVLSARWEFVLTFCFGKGICVTERWPRHTRLGSVGGPPLQWEFPPMKKRQPLAGPAGAKHLAAMETEMFGNMLPLVEHCALRQYDDGEPREPGWITIKTQGAAWCVQVKDPDAACSFTAVAQSLDKAIETAALLLACDEAPWEPDAFLAAAKARKKK